MSRQIHYYAVNIEQNVFHIQIKIENNFLKCVFFYSKSILMSINVFVCLGILLSKKFIKCLLQGLMSVFLKNEYKK
jgi:hypothetical protein